MQLKYNNYTHNNSQSTNKYQLSTEARKSSATHAHRHDVLPYINLLDKCTRTLHIIQKFWERIEFGFETSSKPMTPILLPYLKKPVNQLVNYLIITDLQHLQIKLRKHVTAFKSKAKMEQLMKFK